MGEEDSGTVTMHPAAFSYTEESFIFTRGNFLAADGTLGAVLYVCRVLVFRKHVPQFLSYLKLLHLSPWTIGTAHVPTFNGENDLVANSQENYWKSCVAGGIRCIKS